HGAARQDRQRGRRRGLVLVLEGRGGLARSRRRGATLGRGAHVALDDAAAGPGALDLAQVDAELEGQRLGQRRRQKAARRRGLLGRGLGSRLGRAGPAVLRLGRGGLAGGLARGFLRLGRLLLGGGAGLGRLLGHRGGARSAGV